MSPSYSKPLPTPPQKTPPAYPKPLPNPRPLPKLTASFTLFASSARPTAQVNAAVDAYNRTQNYTNLAVVQAMIKAAPAGHWNSKSREIAALEEAIQKEGLKYGNSPTNVAGLGPSAKVDLSPSKWIHKLFQEAPDISGAVGEGDGKKGTQGSTFKLSVGDKKLIAKADRSKYKGNDETECMREFQVYEKLLKIPKEHKEIWDHLPKVWGWADLKLGNQHEQGFVMNEIDGLDGGRLQKTLKDSWDLGVISSAQYWSSIQYIGRCHVKLMDHLKRAGWLHNDIKPENYMVDKETGEVIVIDLGGASKIGDTPMALTDEYLPPEMLANRKANFKPATVGSNVFMLGATLAQATESPDLSHKMVAPNQGIRITENASTTVKAGQMDNKYQIRARVPYQYGEGTAYTRQLEEMMSPDASVRDRNLHNPKAFLNDSILTDEETRKVLKGIVSGDLKKEFDARWAKAKLANPNLVMPQLPPNRLKIEMELKSRMMNFRKLRPGADESFDPKSPDTSLARLVKKKQALAEFAKLVKDGISLGIDTREYQDMLKQKTRQYAAAEAEIRTPGKANPFEPI